MFTRTAIPPFQPRLLTTMAAVPLSPALANDGDPTPQHQPYRTTSKTTVRLGIPLSDDSGLAQQRWRPRLTTLVELLLWSSTTKSLRYISWKRPASWFIEDWVLGGAPPLGWRWEYMLCWHVLLLGGQEGAGRSDGRKGFFSKAFLKHWL